MKKTICILSIFLFCALSFNNISAQKITVTGTVKDSLTNSALPYCNISVKNSTYGTVSNVDGGFRIKIDSAFHNLVISYLGYESKSIGIYNTGHHEIVLRPVSIELEEVIVDPYTWAERFMLSAIEAKNRSRELIYNSSSDAYSKTYFKHAGMGVVGLVEALSKIYFAAPDFYREKVNVLKISKNLKNIPYSEIAVNQSIDLMNNSSRIGNCSIISPLSDDALDYYYFSQNGRTTLGKDTVVVISIEPAKKNLPLYSGNLYFYLKNRHLVEAELNGNDITSEGVFDSLRVFQKYVSIDGLYNLPSFTKYFVTYDFYGFRFKYNQEYTFINHSINNADFDFIYSTDNILFEESNLSYDLDFKRDEEFKVPLTMEEIEFNKKMVRVFEHGSIFRRAALYLFTDLFPAMLDNPVTFFGLNFSKFSNLYRFNKVEGHYLGFEYQFVNNSNLNITANAGYAFSPRLVEYDTYMRWKNLTLSYANKITALGGLEYLRSMQTLNALIYHKDDMHYFKSTSYGASYRFQFNSKLSFSPLVRFERQTSAVESTEFSIFNGDLKYSPNYQIDKYSNNSAGFLISYIENQEYLSEFKRIYKGESFTNILLRGNFYDKNLFNSTENITEWKLRVDRYQEIYYPLAVNLECRIRYLNHTRFINKMEFVNNLDILSVRNTPLTFYSLGNYDYYLQSYIKLKGDITLFNFPEILGQTISLGGTISFLRPLNKPEIISPFSILYKNFYEYGLSIKGVGLFNFTLLKNNFEKKRLFFRIDFSL